jgi:hypothetical protein
VDAADGPELTVTHPRAPLRPADPDFEGAFEEINGNQWQDFADVVLYFNQMSWITANEPISLFDYNTNGRIDFADVVRLLTHLYTFFNPLPRDAAPLSPAASAHCERGHPSHQATNPQTIAMPQPCRTIQTGATIRLKQRGRMARAAAPLPISNACFLYITDME